MYMYVCMCIYNICTRKWDDKAGVEEGPIGVCERIIIYYTVVDDMSDFFDFFFALTRFSFPKTRYSICAYIILHSRIIVYP